MAKEPFLPASTPQVDEDGSSSGWHALWNTQRWVTVAFTLCLAFLTVYILTPIAEPADLLPVTGRVVARAPSNLQILIPAPKTSLGLCETLLSTSILGYPSPFLINWQQDGGSTHMTKVTGLHNYLSNLTFSHDDDLVLLLDSEHTWLQFRPQALVDRFFDINRRANQRIKYEVGRAGLERNITQKIVFGAQKDCSSSAARDACYAVPESTLPKKIYGPQTDVLLEEGSLEGHRSTRLRPRYLDPSFMMGTVGAMRKLVAEAVRLVEQAGTDDGDLDTFSRVFSGQEIWREILRRESKKSARKIFTEKDLDEIGRKAEATPERTYDFGIGLDYTGEISLNSQGSEKQSAWLQLNDAETIRRTREALGIASSQRQVELTHDVANSLPPYWTFSTELGINRSKSWGEVPLYTNLHSGIAPAVVSSNASDSKFHQSDEGGPPQHRWYQPHARTLMDASIYAPILPVAVAGENANMSREFWPWEIWKGGARDAKTAVGDLAGWLRFDEMCKDWHEELFQDGKGEWLLPENH